jgi:hypothetical protein
MTARRRADVLADLRYWRAAIVVLMPDTGHRAALKEVLTGALGTPRRVGGVDVWDVRALEPAPVPPRW